MRCFHPIFYQKYIHHEINEKERRKVEAHLGICKKCANLVENLKREELKLKKIFEEEIIDFKPLLMEKLELIDVEKKRGFPFYLAIFLFSPLISVVFLNYFAPFIFIKYIFSHLFSPFFYIISLLFSLVIKISNLNLPSLLLQTGILSILVLSFLIFKNIKIEMEVPK